MGAVAGRVVGDLSGRAGRRQSRPLSASTWRSCAWPAWSEVGEKEPSSTTPPPTSMSGRCWPRRCSTPSTPTDICRTTLNTATSRRRARFPRRPTRVRSWTSVRQAGRGRRPHACPRRRAPRARCSAGRRARPDGGPLRKAVPPVRVALCRAGSTPRKSRTVPAAMLAAANPQNRRVRSAQTPDPRRSTRPAASPAPVTTLTTRAVATDHQGRVAEPGVAAAR